MGVVILVRHGQASWGADDYDVLSSHGWEQGRRLGAFLREQGVTPDSVVHGGMRRHRETWEAVAETAGWKAEQAEVDAGWMEFDHESLMKSHGRAGEAVALEQVFDTAISRWLAEPEDPAYPETFAGFLKRAKEALTRVADRPGTTIVVTSGGVISALAAQLLIAEAGPQALAPVWLRLNSITVNTALTRTIHGSRGAHLLTFNEHPHLPRAEVTYR